ncbi:MAG TPA: PKD domain-containing protein [Solirubrobacterales bacterium]|nr:PKD domain-containing protein [Solirubrobacterales bacterium]
MFGFSLSVRGLAAIVGACVLLGAGAASARAAPLAVVGSVTSDEVSVLDTATNQLVRQIKVGDGPASVAVTPDGCYAYVADAVGESVSVVDLSTLDTVGEPIEVGKMPYGIAITPDGGLACVTDREDDEVSVIDTATREKVADITVGTAPAGVAVSPDGKFAYVTLHGDDAVEVIDLETMSVVGKPIPVGTSPEGIELAPDGATAYVADSGSDEVSAIDTATGEVTPILLVEGEEPRGIVVSPDGGRAFVVDLRSESISVIETATAQVSRQIDLGAEPSEVAVSANGKTLYVAEAGFEGSERTTEVQRFDVETGEVIGTTIELPGKFASGIAIAPDQSPVAAFAVPSVTVGVPALFSGAASSDADGRIASFSWTFGDGGTGSGVRVSHTYRAPGTYDASLGVVDDEGCGEEEVFTGRTAYCSGAAPARHPVTVKAPAAAEVGPPGGTPLPPSPLSHPNHFTIRRIVHNRRNGTVRMQVRLPSAGLILLFGPRVHAVTRKSKGAQTMWLTIHARAWSWRSG